MSVRIEIETTGVKVENPDDPRVVWVATWECPDYYCGCSGSGLKVGSHLLGVFGSEEDARSAIEQAAEDWPLDSRPEYERYADELSGVSMSQAFITAVVPGCAFIPGVSPGA